MADNTAGGVAADDGSQRTTNASMQDSFVSDVSVSDAAMGHAFEASSGQSAFTTPSAQAHCLQYQPLRFDPQRVEQTHWVQPGVVHEQQCAQGQCFDEGQQQSIPYPYSNLVIKSETYGKAAGPLVLNMSCLDEQSLVHVITLVCQHLSQVHQAKHQESKDMQLKIDNLEAKNEIQRRNQDKVTAEITQLHASMADQLKLLDEAERRRIELESKLSICEQIHEKLEAQLGLSETNLRAAIQDNKEKEGFYKRNLKKHELFIETHIKAEQDRVRKGLEAIKEASTVYSQLPLDSDVQELIRYRQNQYLDGIDPGSESDTVRVPPKRQRVPQLTPGGEHAKKARIANKK